MSNILTDENIDSIVEVAKECRVDSNNNDKITVDAELLTGEIKNDNIEDIFSNNFLEDIEDVDVVDSDADIFNTNKEISKDIIASTAKENYDLTDEEVLSLIDVITGMKGDPYYPVYDNVPEKMKEIIRQLAVSNKIPESEYNNVARMTMEEFMSEANLNSSYIDIEKSLDNALKMPSIMDIYTEHTREVMEVNLPKMIEAIKDEEPDKAEALRKVKEAFTKSYNFSFAKEKYEANTRLRKAIRRNNVEFKRAINEFNFRNQRSNFKMSDVTELPPVLHHILIDEPNRVVKSYSDRKMPLEETDLEMRILKYNITNEDIEKFSILICKSCEDMNPCDVIDAAYMYYLTKNIIVLKLANEAKTDFAAELIINICDTIAFIRNKEGEFYAANSNKSKSPKKHNSK